MEANAEESETTNNELSVGDRVTVLVSMTSDSEPSHKVDLPEGTVGTIRRIDDAGDAYIAFAGCRYSQWILKENLHNLATEKGLASEEDLDNMLVNSIVGETAGSLDDLIVAMRQLTPDDRKTLVEALHSMEAKVEECTAKPTTDLSVGDRVTVLVSMISDSEPRHKVDLPEGTVGTIRKIDDDGDAYIAFAGFRYSQWILKENLDNLATEKALTSKEQLFVEREICF